MKVWIEPMGGHIEMGVRQQKSWTGMALVRTVGARERVISAECGSRTRVDVRA